MKKDFDEFYNEASSLWATWLTEQTINMKFYLGDQWDANDKKYLDKFRRAVLVFNKIRRIVHMLSGYQRKNRLALVAHATIDEAAPLANDMSDVLMWVMQQGGYHTMSAAFSGMLKTSLNFVEPYMDYSSDPVSGDIKFKRIPYNAILIDPYTTEQDLSDCGYILSRRYATKEMAQMIIPSAEKKIETIQPSSGDGKFVQFVKRGRQEGYYIDELCKAVMKNRKLMVNIQSGEYHNWNKSVAEYKIFVNANNLTDKYKLVNFPLQEITKIMYVNGEKVSEDELDFFPYVPIWGFFNPEYSDKSLALQAIVQSLRDPQTEINKRRSKMLDIIDNQIASGWVAQEDALVNAKSLERTGTNQVVLVKRNHSVQEVQKLPSTDIPSGLFQLNQLFEKDIMDIPGANSEMFGQPSKDYLQEASLLAKMRESAGLTIFQDLFDSYRLSKKMLGNILVKMIQDNFSPAKIAQILGHQTHTAFFDKKFAKYDIIPQEAMLTDTQRELFYTQLLMLKKLGAPINWQTIIEASPIQGQAKLRQSVEQATEAQARAAKEEEANRVEMNRLLQTKAMSNIAVSEEKKAKAELETVNAKIKQEQLLTTR